jgi:c-di-GMP-binding flagellar brake protein YcgR
VHAIDPIERRQTHRVKVCGGAVLHGAGLAVRCRIVDLSNGGIGLRHDHRGGFAGVLLASEVTIDLDLDMDEQRITTISHRGTVRHVDLASGRMGVEFESLPEALAPWVRA